MLKWTKITSKTTCKGHALAPLPRVQIEGLESRIHLSDGMVPNVPVPYCTCFACCVARALQASMAAVSISGGATANANVPYTLSLASPDPAAGKIASWKVDWGDGNIQTISGNPSSVTHNYASIVARWGMPVYVQALATNEDGTSIGGNSLVLSVQAPPDVTPPAAVLLSAANINAATGSSYQFTVAFSDNEQMGGYNLYTATSPLTVTGPNGFSQTCQFISALDGVDGLSATGIYSITPPNGTWNFTNNGLYTVSLNDRAVKDFSGNYAVGGVLGTFKVAMPVPDLGGSGVSDAAYMGIMSSGSNQTIQDFVSKGDRHDFYRVRIKSDMSIDTKLYGMSDNVDLQLLDGNGKAIASSAKIGTTSDAITQNVSAGTYFLHVSYSGSSSTSYSLRISGGTPITTKTPKAQVFSNVALHPLTNLLSGKAA